MTERDERFEMAQQLAADVRAAAEELSTAIYQAKKMGYECSLSVRNAKFLGAGKYRGSPVIDATVSFDIGKAVL